MKKKVTIIPKKEKKINKNRKDRNKIQTSSNSVLNFQNADKIL